MPIDHKDIAKLNTIIKEINIKPESEPFRYPVDYKALGLDDYPLIISKMMDLSTVSRNLQNSSYLTKEECLDDLQLIWDNCKLYNVETSKIHKLALKLESLVQKLVEENFGELEYGKNNPSYFALQEKAKPRGSCNM